MADRIELIDWPFAGHYQADKYWYEWERQGASRSRYSGCGL